jgi:thiol-disulfide isomerase/thioredoxin
VKTTLTSARTIALAIVALVVCVGGYASYRALAGSERAPNVGYTLLDGSKSTTDQLRGKVVLVNFWATDCTACLHEMPKIIATHQKFNGRGFETLSVSMRYDAPASVIDYAVTRKLPFSVAIDITGDIAKSFGNVELTPTSVLINKRGEIVKRYVGEPDFVALNKLVEKLLAET